MTDNIISNARYQPCRVCVVVIASLVVLVSHPTSAQTQTPAWERWETALKSTRHYENPCRDVALRVAYTGPKGRSMRAYGFWDGGDVFRIRCAFPTPGVWNWRTECSDSANAGLHGQSGTMHVTPYQGDNPLYKHGFLRVSANGHYLCHADQTPFLWMGDTAWAGPMKAPPADWETYLADRLKKRFTVIQIGPASEWARRDYLGEIAPFIGEGITQPNPAFWQAYEQRVQRANEKGLFVMMVGLMEPFDRYPDSAEACVFARQIVARLYGNFIAFSPSFDSKYMTLADDVGTATRDATAAHLITQHPGTPSGQPTQTFAETYFDRSYMDFAGNQTGHNGGNRERCASQAISWNLQLYGRQPRKPVINLEAFYDGDDMRRAKGPDDPIIGNAMDARSLGWRTWLSGAAGYTYGSLLYRWQTDPQKSDYWRSAMALTSSEQMTAMHDFLAGLEWWRLEPAHELIRNQPKQASKRMVMARTARGDLAVAYLPDNSSIEIDLSNFPATLSAKWFDPVHNSYADIQGTMPNAGVHSFAPPKPGDWVLLLKRL